MHHTASCQLVQKTPAPVSLLTRASSKQKTPPKIGVDLSEILGTLAIYISKIPVYKMAFSWHGCMQILEVANIIFSRKAQKSTEWHLANEIAGFETNPGGEAWKTCKNLQE